ncbi:MAG TPA: PEP-CTERM sorting domain-containing protein [Bryobacteraceae bacterium]|nr:PEP-CTERM sorting domain-containing protein [Bryobacteraceae bacterium]
MTASHMCWTGLALALGLSLGAATARADLVTNGGFETGTLEGWTNAGWATDTSSFFVQPVSGNYFAKTGVECQDTSPCTLSQTLSTTPGQEYTFSFDFNPGLNADGYFFTYNGDTKVSWGGVQIIDLVGGALGWTHYSFTEEATGSSTTISFYGYQDPSFNGLDNVSVNALPTAVPEPGTWTMLLLGLGGLGAMLRTRPRRSPVLGDASRCVLQD